MAPGKTAPRLLQDLLTYDPRHEERAGRNLLTSPPPQHDDSKPGVPAVPTRNCRHALIIKPDQSQLSVPGDDPDNTTVYKVASYCSQCRWHVDVIVDFRNDGSKSKPCKKGDEEYMLHHFLFENDGAESHNTNGLGSDKAPRSYTFRCSAPPCPATVHIHMRPPHLSDVDIQTLTNKAQLRQRLEYAKQLAGDRADSDMARCVDGPDYLITYLTDALNPVRGKSRIPLLNRKFLKTFGRSCDSILLRLGWTTQHEEEGQAWYLPQLQALDPSSESNLRQTIKDTIYELHAIIRDLPETERADPRHSPIYPLPARDHVERALACHDYAKVEGRVQTRSATHEEDHPYYAGLGAVGDFSDDLLLWAYARQTAVDLDNRSYYFECLKGIAVGRKSEALGMHVAMLGSQGLHTKSDVNAAYLYFNIDPAHVMRINDEHIVGVFRSRLSDEGPVAVEMTRKQLHVIGDARESSLLRAEATGALETYEQALSWLELGKEQPDDFVPTMFALKTQDTPSSVETARKAVSLIAEHRNSARLRLFLKEGTMMTPEMDIGEAYALFSINDRTAVVDFDVMNTVINFAPAESAEKLRKAYELIEQDQAQNLDNRSGQSEARRNDYALETWPVGLRNIGNTCYLNSVLQFLFTIKPLRNMVLDCDHWLQDPSPEALRGKKVGRTAVTAERVEVAQKFIQELRRFFEHMITAPTDTVQPAIDLAALALCKTDSPQSDSKSFSLDTETTDGLGLIEGMAVIGPMLPSNNNEDPTVTKAADSVMGDDKSDTSMQAMELGDDAKPSDSTTLDKPAPPNRPPPVPPRPGQQAKSKLGNIEESARQQDAAEVLSNIFDLISCAIKGTDVLREDEQFDMIKELFFSDVTSVRNTKPKQEQSYELRDHFLVSPGWRDRNIYACLDDDFGLSEMEGGITKFDFIDKAAPVQIINLRRLQFDRAKGEQIYDRAHIGLEQVLYLDRYLKETRSLPELQLLKLREEQWEKQRQLQHFDERRVELRNTGVEDIDMPDNLEASSDFTKGLIEGADLDGGETRLTFSVELPDSLQDKANELKQELEHINSRISRLESEMDDVFRDARDRPYRLHAIFTHRGGTKGGHYWIYIYDFQNELWRRYNDDRVELVSSSDIFERETGNMPSASTGVVYIRKDLIHQLTEAVRRQPAIEPTTNGHAETQMSDYQMPDADEEMPALVPITYNNLQVIHGVEENDFDVGFQRLDSMEVRQVTFVDYPPHAKDWTPEPFSGVDLPIVGKRKGNVLESPTKKTKLKEVEDEVVEEKHDSMLD